LSWAARITKAPDGGLRLVFSEPLKSLDMDAAVARRLGSLLLVAAEEVAPAGRLDSRPANRGGKRNV
jgi:hypothetical protein